MKRKRGEGEMSPFAAEGAPRKGEQGLAKVRARARERERKESARQCSLKGMSVGVEGGSRAPREGEPVVSRPQVASGVRFQSTCECRSARLALRVPSPFEKVSPRQHTCVHHWILRKKISLGMREDRA